MAGGGELGRYGDADLPDDDVRHEIADPGLAGQQVGALFDRCHAVAHPTPTAVATRAFIHSGSIPIDEKLLTQPEARWRSCTAPGFCDTRLRLSGHRHRVQQSRRNWAGEQWPWRSISQVSL